MRKLILFIYMFIRINLALGVDRQINLENSLFEEILPLEMKFAIVNNLDLSDVGQFVLISQKAKELASLFLHEYARNNIITIKLIKSEISFFEYVISTIESGTHPYLKIKVLNGKNTDDIFELYSLCQYVIEINMSFNMSSRYSLYEIDKFKNSHLNALKNLTSLNLRNNCIGDKGVMALATILSLAKLESLNLELNAIHKARALYESPTFDKLKLLNLRKNEIDDKAKELISKRFPFVILDDKVEIPLNFKVLPRIIKINLLGKDLYLEFKKVEENAWPVHIHGFAIVSFKSRSSIIVNNIVYQMLDYSKFIVYEYYGQSLLPKE